MSSLWHLDGLNDFLHICVKQVKLPSWETRERGETQAKDNQISPLQLRVKLGHWIGKRTNHTEISESPSFRQLLQTFFPTSQNLSFKPSAIQVQLKSMFNNEPHQFPLSVRLERKPRNKESGPVCIERVQGSNYLLVGSESLFTPCWPTPLFHIQRLYKGSREVSRSDFVTEAPMVA